MSPCKDCTRRSDGCHEDCREYHEWKKTTTEINRKIQGEYSESRRETFEEMRRAQWRKR